MRGLLVGISPFDSVTLAAVAVGLALVAPAGVLRACSASGPSSIQRARSGANERPVIGHE